MGIETSVTDQSLSEVLHFLSVTTLLSNYGVTSIMSLAMITLLCFCITINNYCGPKCL